MVMHYPIFLDKNKFSVWGNLYLNQNMNKNDLVSIKDE